MNHTQELMETVNPIFKTAKMTLFQLMSAGDTDAKAIAERLGLTFEETQGSASLAAPKDDYVVNTTMMEIRFRTMGVLKRQSTVIR